jgi:hypothetical protein
MDHRFTHAGIKRTSMKVVGNPSVFSEAETPHGTRGSGSGSASGSDKAPFSSAHAGNRDADGSSNPTDTYNIVSTKRNGAWPCGGVSDPADSYPAEVRSNQQQRRAAESNDVKRR